MASRARLSQERSRLRRDALLDAAIELFAEGGSRAVTHRAVAATAGLPSATTTYYFATIEDLLHEALRRHIDQWVTALRPLADVDARSLAPLMSERSAAQTVESLLARGPSAIATRELAVVLGAARDPQLRSAVVGALQTAVDLLETVLDELAVPDARGLAEDVAAVIGGVALRRVVAVNSAQQEAAKTVRAVSRLVVGHLTDARAAAATMAALQERALRPGPGRTA